MKTPVFGSNRLQSFIDFVTTFGKMRIGLEGLRIFAEVNDMKLQIDGKLLNQTFEGVISLGQGLTHYNDFTVDAALVVALESNPIIGGSAEIRFIGDGATTPTFSADFTAGPTSGAYDSTLAAVNKVVFYYDGTDAFYSIVSGDSIFGNNPTPVARTKSPIIGANSVNANIDALDTAIGADIVPGTRTTGQLSMAADLLANLKLIDDVIGFDAQMPLSSLDVSRALTIYQNLRALDTKKSVRTIRVKVGNFGVASCDFNFAANANHAEQSINLGALLPAKARFVDAMIYTDAAFTNLGALTTDLGLASGTAEYIGAGNNTAIDSILATTNAGAFISTPNKNALDIWLNVDPANNWDSANPVGRMSVYITFIDVTNI